MTVFWLIFAAISVFWAVGIAFRLQFDLWYDSKPLRYYAVQFIWFLLNIFAAFYFMWLAATS